MEDCEYHSNTVLFPFRAHDSFIRPELVKLQVILLRMLKTVIDRGLLGYHGIFGLGQDDLFYVV